ncbi:unnamed protein product [Amoebophrya sp. A120]|nr:unnamed protein product [Amoebophrya sp. A120]|eukprot:GSA120T00000619001.1
MQQQRPQIADIENNRGNGPGYSAMPGSSQGLFADPLGIRNRRSSTGSTSNANNDPGANDSSKTKMPGTRKSFSDHDRQRQTYNRIMAKSMAAGNSNQGSVPSTGSQLNNEGPTSGAQQGGLDLSFAGSNANGGTGAKKGVDVSRYVQAQNQPQGYRFSGQTTSTSAGAANMRGGAGAGGATSTAATPPSDAVAGNLNRGMNNQQQLIQAVPRSGRSARYREAEKESLFDWSAVANCCGLRDRDIPAEVVAANNNNPMSLQSSQPRMNNQVTTTTGSELNASRQENYGDSIFRSGRFATSTEASKTATANDPSNLLGYWQEEDESDLEAQNKERQKLAAKIDAQFKSQDNMKGETSAESKAAAEAKASAAKKEAAAGSSKSLKQEQEARSKLYNPLSSGGTTPFKWPAWALSKRPGLLEVRVVDDEHPSGVPQVQWLIGIPKQRVVDESGADAFLLCEYDWHGERFEEDFPPSSVRRAGQKETVADLWQSGEM